MGCAVVRCKGGPQVIQYDAATKRGHNRGDDIEQQEMESSSTGGGVQHVDEAGEQPGGSNTMAAKFGQREDEGSRFTFKPVPSDKALPDVVIAPPQAKNLEQRHSISRLLLDRDEANTTAALKLRLLLQQLDQGELPNILEMKKTILYAADVLLGLVPRPMTEEENDENAELRREREQHVKAWVCSQYAKNETTQESRITPIERFRAVANTIMIGNFFGTLHREASFSRPKYPAGMDELFQEQLNNWDFDIFKAESLSNKQPLRYVGQELFTRHDLFRRCNISSQHLDNFLSKIEAGYGRYSNPYHNATHAADVAVTTHYFIHSLGLKAYLTDLEVLAILLSAIIHDVDHPGTTNAFQIAQKSEYAMLYNDQSVLENHHLYYTFMIIREDDSDVLNGLSSEQYAQVRKTMVDIVLATDMSTHFDQIKQLKLILSGQDASTQILGPDRSKLFNFLVHMADISHPGKPWDHHTEWTDRLCKEFFRQGDKERELGRKCSPLCDRYETDIPDSQHGFIQFIVGPSFDVCGDMFEIVLSHPVPSQSPQTPASIKTVQPTPGTDSSGSDEEGKTGENLNSSSSKQIRVWADHLTDNKKRWKLESAKNEAEKAAQKAEEEKAQELVPVKTNKVRDLLPVKVPPVKVPSSEQNSNGNDLNSPTDSSDNADSSDHANQSGSEDSGGKMDSNDASDHSDSSDLVNHTEHKSHPDSDNCPDSNNHKHMNGSTFEKAEFHNKMNKLEETHTISTMQTVQIPGGSEVRTVQTVELRKITTNGTQQATFQNRNNEE